MAATDSNQNYREATLLELVSQLSLELNSPREVETRALELLCVGRIRLIGSFRSYSWSGHSAMAGARYGLP